MSSTLGQDLLLEILVRVPVKSLLKCMCVCKSWHSLITNPCFISFQIKHLNSKNDSNNNDHHVMVLQDDILKKQLAWKLCKDNETLDEITTVDFPFGEITNVHSFTILGCVNGLLCLLESVVYQPYSLVIWNPTIRKYLVLPSPCFDDNPMSCFSVYGFGFSDPSMDHKVVRITRYQIESFFDQRMVGPFAEVYSLSKGSWKCIEPPFSMPCSSKQVYLNGSIHWLAYRNQTLILRFDLEHETFSEIEVPKELNNARLSTLSIEKWVDSLAIFEVKSCLGSINLWVRNKEFSVKNSWMKHLVIESLGIVRLSIVGVGKNGEILMKSIEGRFVMYDPKKDRLEDSKIEGSKKFEMVSYHESLALFDKERAKRY